VARDRQRAKQRKARRAQNPGRAPSRPQPSEPESPLDHNVPSELGHLGEVDEFEAAIVSGSDRRGDDASEAFVEEAEAFVEEEDPEARREAVADTEEEGEDEQDELDEDFEEEAVAAAPAERREVAPAGGGGAPTKRGPGRFIGFLRASWAELQRVQWPDRRQVAQATAVVIGFVVVAGIYLGVADWVAKKIVDFII
jgi:preprotein translocase subunit SecE